ncbi:MipA/OmpV family protein [Salmonella enterica]|nr:MipA/OmpV family protein [Salmonella enterica]
MNGFRLLAFCTTISMSVHIVQAKSEITLGGGVGVVEHPYKEYDANAYLIPVLSYSGEHFWVRGLGGGGYLWNDSTDKLSITGYWSPVYFKANDSNDRQLRLLDNRRSTMMAGISWSHHTPYGFLRTSLAGDVLNNSNGAEWDIAWLYHYINGGFTLTPGVGGEWSSKKQNQYYYGVSQKESNRSGMSRYEPKDGWSPYVEISTNYNFTGNWNIYGSARYSRLSDEIADSPMVDRSWSGLFSTGITYSF